MVCKITKDKRIETLTKLFSRIDNGYDTHEDDNLVYWLHVKRRGFSKISINAHSFEKLYNQPHKPIFNQQTAIAIRFNIEDDKDFYEDVSKRLDEHYRRMKLDTSFDNQYIKFKKEYDKQIMRLTNW